MKSLLADKVMKQKIALHFNDLVLAFSIAVLFEFCILIEQQNDYKYGLHSLPC